MSVEATVRDYYEALRRGEPLYPYFAEDAGTVKVGVSEYLTGYDAVAEALREQTRRTDEWTVDSGNLVVTERDAVGWFGDEVELAWTDTTTGQRYSFGTRWTGTLERRSLADEDADGTVASDPDEVEWLFASMHVSAPHRL